MRILIVSRYKNNFTDHQLPFVTEQGTALAALSSEGMSELGNERIVVDYFLVKGNYIAAVRELKRKIREFKPDIIHAHFGLSAITAELQNLVPVVTTFHNGETLNWHVNLMSSLMSLRAKHVIYVAQHIRDLSYFKARNYSIIPCGVPMEQMIITPKEEARKQLGWSDDKKYILFGGAFSNTRKNYALLRDAVKQLEIEDWRLKIEVGENKNKENTACAEENKENNLLEVTENTHPTVVDETNVLDCHPSQPLTSELAASASDNTPNSTNQDLPVGCLQKHLFSVGLDSPPAFPFRSAKSQHFSMLTKTDENIHAGQEESGELRVKSIEIVEMKGLSRAECVLRMCAADVFALPSHSEGSPQALKEAMAVNCPCIATDIADVRELFGDEPGHWILRNPRKTHERWDADEKSLDEMVELLNAALKFEGRTKGRERILELELSNEQVARRIIRIYQEILESEK